MRSRSLLALGLLFVGVLPVSAQLRQIKLRLPEEKESRYVPFAFNNNPEALVKGQLDTLKKMEPYKEFVEKLLRDPGKFKVDPELVKQLKLSDPNVQDKLKKWVGDGAKGKPPVSPEQLKRLQDELQKIVKDQPDVGSMPPIPPPIEAPPDVPPPDLDGDARGSLKEIMEKMEESKFGEWLRDSPAWHRAIEDLYRSVRFPRVQPNAGGFERLTRGMFRLDKLPLPNAAALERLGKLKPPSLPRWMPSLPSLPSIGRPSLPSVAPPPMPTAASLGTLAAWLLCLALVALFAWQASKWIKWTDRRRRGAAVDLGPWPVDPQQVATRAELVRAFDHLALLRLGTQARTWNHNAVARGLAEHAAAQAESAALLAACYERALHRRDRCAVRRRARPGPPCLDPACGGGAA